MKRRQFLTHSALFTASTMIGTKLALANSSSNTAAHHHTSPSLLNTATDCLAKGELCLQHCMESLSSGDKSMAGCAATVREMLIYCDALAKATARKSKHLKAIAKIALKACQECESECRKHKSMDVCLACAEACASCASDCESA